MAKYDIIAGAKMVNDDNTSIARAAITLKPSVYMGNPNPNVHLKSNATANEITKLIISY